MNSAVTPTELMELKEQGRAVDLVDVRTPTEFREVHAEPARNVPLDALDPAGLMAERNGDRDEPLYLICRSGSRARQAAEKFRQAGFENVVEVEGGTAAWEEAGLPVKRGQKAVSLERQVRIAAGALVLTGSLLAFFVHPYWWALPAFVGAGLMYAGITDTCGMAMVLAKAPWNQVKD